MSTPAARPVVLRAGLFAAAFFLAAVVGDLLAIRHYAFTTFWPPAGLYLAALLLTPTREWPIFLGAAAAANFAFDLGLRHERVPPTVGFYLSNTAQAVAAAALVRRVAGGVPQFGRLRDVLALVGLGALAVPALAAFLGAGIVAGSSADFAFTTAWAMWWISNALGILSVTPLLVVWRRGDPRDTPVVPPHWVAESSILIGVLAIMIIVMRGGLAPTLPPRPYLVFPLLVWAALRLGPPGTAVALFGSTLLVVGVVVMNFVPDFDPHLPPAARVLQVQVFLCVVTITSLVLTAVVAEQRRAEHGLRDSESRLREAQAELFRREQALKALVENSPDVISRTGPDLRLRYVNPAVVRLVGRPAEECLGRTWGEVGLPAAAVRPWEEGCRAAFADGAEHSLEWQVQHGDEVRHYFVRVIPERGPDGIVESVLGIASDVSERMRVAQERHTLEGRIQQAQKLESLGVLAGGIAHDFNNILTSVLGYADLALLDLPVSAPARAHIEQLMIGARRAADLTHQMLAYSGKGRFVVQVLDLADVVREMITLLEVSISKKCVLKFRFADNLPAIEADPTQLRQVIMNLIVNASEAIGERSGVIAVSTGTMECDRAYLAGSYLDENLPEGTYVYLEVADTGVGMDEATRVRIFEPFFTTKFTGRGLGLAAVLGIVRGHRGAIKVYTEPGRGTTFKVLFPTVIGSVSPAAAPLAGSASGWRGSGVILIVDDEEAVRVLARSMLTRVGFTVLTAADGRQGVETFRAVAEDVRLVLLDMTMPHMDGEEAFREMRRIRPDARVVLTSGYNEQDATTRFAGKGLAGFLQKPFRFETLLTVLRKALGE
jgi:PAS domain S-box-containing protein